MLTQKIPQIQTIFAQNPKLIRSPTIPPQKRVLELEAKYGRYIDDGFESTVRFIHYERLLERLRASPNIWSETSEESQVAQDKNQIRRITTTVSGDGAETVLWQRKTRASPNIELPEYNIRISANVEETLLQGEIPLNFSPTMIRDRTRHTFAHVSGLVKVDLTEVMMQRENQVIIPGYEVEVEYLGTSKDIKVFTEQIETVFKLLNGTNLIYTNAVKEKLINDVAAIIGGTPGKDGFMTINRDSLVEARNIKHRDLVYGGIVGNQSLINDKILATPKRPGKEGSGTNYMITFKADGLRKMFVIHTSGIWLIYPPFEFNLVLDNTLKVPQLDRLLTSLNGTILDGELVIPRKPKNIAYWYLGFDCLAFRGNAGIQRHPYTDRQKVVLSIAAAVKTPIITVGTKDTEEIKNPQDFFRLMNRFLNERNNQEYDEDGLIFVPIDTFYNPRSNEYDLKDRTLTNLPDVLKYKESSDITIDFALRWLPGGRLELHSFDPEKGTTVAFQGNNINPLTPDMIEHDNPLTLNKPSGAVFEYEWIWLPNPEGGKRIGKLRPRRARPDKRGPNGIAIALDDWEDIMNPITEEEIRGENLKMVFSYHNRIKTNLYNVLTKNPTFNPKVRDSKKFIGANILDIGSGRGGDTSKWLRLTDKDDPNSGFIVAVEPNPNYREELVRRISTFNLGNKVEVVPTGGEDTLAITNAVKRHIPGGKVDAVTLMLSMSFFWASSDHLEALIQTIVTNLKPGGKVIFLTIDGDTVEQIFEPALGGPKITDLSLAVADIHLYPRPLPPFGRAVDFTLPDTIVGEQREYIVHLQDFSLRLGEYGINLYESHRAEGEKLLSDSNSLFSSMYTFGYYVNDDKIALPQVDQPGTVITNIILPAIPSPIKSSDIKMEPEVLTPHIVVPNPTVPIINIITPRPVSPRPTVEPLPHVPVITGATITPAPVTSTPIAKIVIPNLPIPAFTQISVPVPGTKPTKHHIEHNQLRMLDVSYTRAGKIIQGPAKNDDTYAPLTCSWYKNLVRIATIGDGSCFIHAVLKGFYRGYQENNQAIYRLQVAAKIRRDLGVVLQLDNPAYPGHTYWETSARGSFPRMVMQEINDEELIRDLHVDYSLSGLQRLFNSTSQLGDEVYTFISDALNVDIYVLRATTTDLYPHYHTHRPGVDRNGVVIIGNTYHYEVLAVNTEQGFQTVFYPDDPFLKALTQLFIGDGDFNDIVNTIPYDPDRAFIADFVEAFTTNAGLQIPVIIDEIFPETDPFIIALNRLMPQIEEAARIRTFDLNGGIVLENPVLDRLNRILNVMKDSGYDDEQLYNIREIIEHRVDPNNPQSLDNIVSNAETDGLLSHDVAAVILNVNTTF